MKKGIFSTIGEIMDMIKAAVFATAVAIAFNTGFAQAQTSDTEIGYLQKLEAMEAQCGRISKAVPCGVGSRVVDNATMAVKIAGDNALAELGKSIQAFVSYHSGDSSYAEGEISKQLYSANSIIEVKNVHIANSKTIDSKIGSFVNSEGNVRYYAIIIKTLDSPEPLYEEAKKIDSVAVAAVPATSAKVSKMAEPKAAAVPQNTAKIDYKKVAVKTIKFILGLAGVRL
jgi:hypothetical protein